MVETVVVALNHVHFRAWCIDNKRSPHDPRIRCISTSDGGFERRLHGLWLEETEVVFYGPWQEGKFWMAVSRTIRQRGGPIT